ncbi:MAG TPA: hypothetical protein VGP54_03010 [Gaiellaceae bacterium]|jgi:hypothetical protein|nr:hypothetical protein [Gaiellaceae bacterium]
MTSAAVSLVDKVRLSRRRELLLGAALTAGFAALLHAVGPAPGDAPVHLYRTFLVRDGALIWDNFWYAGTYPLASYSLLYYLPAALVGNLPLVFAAAVASTVLFSSIASREWGSAAVWPSRVFGVLAAAPLFTGLYAYSLGFAAMLATLKLLQLRRLRLAAVVAALTVGFSPLAFAFLCLVVGSYAVSRRQISRRHVWFGVALAAAAGIEVLALVLFPSGTGVYPFHWIDFGGVLLVTSLGVLVARQARGAGPLVSFYALWGLGSIVVYLVPSPLGDNWTRLSAFVFPVMLLTASLAGFRPRRLVVFALAVAFAYNVVPYALLVPSRLDNQTQQASFWRPAIDFLRAHEQPGYRVEVVPTAEHWEAYWIPKSGFPLARGWYRQLDTVDNPALYAKNLDADAYRNWLRADAVRYVLLSTTAPLDWDGGPQEARVLHSARSGLEVVFRSRNWTIYRLPHATALLTGPAHPVVTAFGHTVIRGRVFAAGRYLLRAHYNPYWHLNGPGCVTQGPNKMTILELAQPARFALTVPGTPEELVGQIVDGKGAACSSS